MYGSICGNEFKKVDDKKEWPDFRESPPSCFGPAAFDSEDCDVEAVGGVDWAESRSGEWRTGRAVSKVQKTENGEQKKQRAGNREHGGEAC